MLSKISYSGSNYAYNMLKRVKNPASIYAYMLKQEQTSCSNYAYMLRKS